MIFRNLATIGAALTLLAAMPVAAQNRQEVSFRVLCFEHNGDVTELKSPVKGGREMADVPLYTSGFSDPIKGSFEGGTARLYRPAEGDEEGPVPMAEGKLAKGQQQAFLLVPDKEGPLAYRILAMNEDEESFPMGTTRVINFANLPIRLSIGGTDLPAIPPGKSVVYPKVSKVDDWGMYSARMDFGTPDGKWVPVTTQSWKSSELKRDIVITTLDPRTRRPAVKLYKDIPPWRVPEIEVGGEN